MDSTTAQVLDPTIRQAIDSTVAHVTDSSVRHVVDSTARALDSHLRNVIDSSNAQLIDSITATVIDKTEPSWVIGIIGIVITAILSGIIGYLLWRKQHKVESSERVENENIQYAKVWGLALFELREAISRSQSFLTNLNTGRWSLGVLYLSKTVESDYFKSHSKMSVTNTSLADDMHWMWGMLNQIQQNIQTSRLTDEARQAREAESKKQKYIPLYAIAAAGFVESHEDTLVSKFNSCLREWRKLCEDNDIELNIELKEL